MNIKMLLWLGGKVSFKNEIRIVLATLAVIFILPLFAVVLIANAGVAVVASALAAVNPVTHLIEIFNPNGEKIAEFQAATVWPVGGMVTTEFGTPHWPYQKYHTGMDIADPYGRIGKPITPFMNGKVLDVIDSSTGFGKHVIVDHGNNVTAIYGHLSELRAKKGQEVKPGDIIGLEGSTGTSTGPHLHFETRVFQVPVNPRTFMVGDPPPGLD